MKKWEAAQIVVALNTGLRATTMRDWGHGEPEEEEPVEHDPIDRPAHYLQSKIEPAEFIEQADLGWCAGNVVKYLVRFKHKNGLEDLKKARAYLEMMIMKYEEWYGEIEAPD
jgi:hypothetical protein